jgi:hypothetical protein
MRLNHVTSVPVHAHPDGSAEVNLETRSGNDRGLELELGLHSGGHTERLLRLCKPVFLRIEPVAAGPQF